MLDWTDRHYRHMARQITRHTWLYTEMINAGAVIYGDPDRFLLKNDGENPVALQLGGSEPQDLAKAAAKAATPADDQILPEGSEIEIDADTDAGIRTLTPATALSPKNRTASQPEAPASDAAQGEDNLF